MSDELLHEALEVFRTVPEWGEIYCRREDACIAVGVPEEVAMTLNVKKYFDRLVNGANQRWGPPVHLGDYDSNIKRTLYLYERVCVRFDRTPTTKAPVAWIMRLAGFPERDTTAGKAYQKIHREVKKLVPASMGPSNEPTPPPKAQKKRPQPAPFMESAPQMQHQMFQKQPPMSQYQPQMLPPPQLARMTPPLAAINVSKGPPPDDTDNISPLSAQEKARQSFGGSPTVVTTSTQESSGVNSSLWYQLPSSFGKEYSRNAALIFGEDYLETAQGSSSTSLSSSSSSIASSDSKLISWKEARKAAVPLNSAIHHLTTTKGHRRTTEAAHVVNQNTREFDNIRSTMCKAGTIIYQAVTKGRNPLKIFQTADAVAHSLNNLIGITAVSGRELREAIPMRRVGQSPPRMGRQGEVPIEDFQAFCQAVFTLCAIEQANAEGRSTREQLKSVCGEVLNEKRRDDGLQAMADSKFYARIEREICHLQDLSKADTRESLRVLWLTYQAQKKHYENWEASAVALGFARHLHESESPEEEGYIIWKKNRLAHVLQFDEMNIALDGTDESIGGRESRIPTARTIGLSDSGQSAEKSGASATLMLGFNFAGEAFPPLFILPTQSKNPDNYRLKVEFAAALPQVHGQYGFKKRMAFNVPFAMNPKGGMTKDMLKDFFDKCVLPLYPSAADDDDHRLLIKVDSGPGRMHPPMLRKLRAHGAHLHPGLPNGTEAGQECDQAFGYLKRIIYSNRKKIWSARFQLEGKGTQLALADLAPMVFGGTVTLTDGSSIELENAWEMAFDADHIHAAMDKCGYCPSTRVALNATQIRHEVIEDLDGEVDAEEDPYGALLEELENQNKAAVRELKGAGYSLAGNLSRAVKRVTAAQVRGRESAKTEPNTRERQDAIMGVSKAGGWFHVTDGGAPMTSDDALIAFYRKEAIKEADEMEKRKKQSSVSSHVAVDAAAILALGKECKDWKKGELQTMIRWKQGQNPVAPNDDNTNVNKPVLMKLWTDKYEHLAPPVDGESGAVWTEEDEAKLEKLRSGDITSFAKDVGLEAIMDTEDEYLTQRIIAIGRERRDKVLRKIKEEEEALEDD